MDEEKITRDVNDLIMSICSQVKGVGPAKAGAVAAEFEGNLSDFLEADSDRFVLIANSRGKPHLNDTQIAEIIDAKSKIPSGLDITNAWVFFLGNDFLQRQVDTLDKLSLDNIDINPLLATILDLKEPKAILEFNLYQSVTRSVVTSWGMLVEKLLVRCGADEFVAQGGGRTGRSPDVQKTFNGIEHLIQVKSGPNTMNVDMVQSLNEVIVEYSKKRPDAKVILGMTYGTRDAVSSQIKDNLSDFDNTTLIGRELWDFVSEQENFHRKLFKILDDASSGVLSKPFSELMADKLNDLVTEWESRHQGLPLEDILDKYM